MIGKTITPVKFFKGDDTDGNARNKDFRLKPTTDPAPGETEPSETEPAAAPVGSPDDSGEPTKAHLAAFLAECQEWRDAVDLRAALDGQQRAVAAAKKANQSAVDRSQQIAKE